MLDLERRTRTNGHGDPNDEDAEQPVADQPTTPAKKWDKTKLMEKLDKNTKSLLRIEEMYQRLVKAREYVEKGSVHRIKLVRNHYTVDGDQSGDYLVNNGRCNCDGAQSRFSAIKGWCEHRIAVEIFKRDVE